MATEAINKQFRDHLRKVLNCLYDPTVLSNSPLLPLFQVKSAQRSASALRAILTNAIESLRPQDNTPLDSRTWRVYQILRRRYTEQLTQHEVARDLGLSVRQLQREEKLAREVLEHYLWGRYDLEAQVQQVQQHAVSEGETAEGRVPTRDQELAHLRDAVSPTMTGVALVLEDVLQTLQPLVTASAVAVVVDLDASVPRLLLKAPLLRQVLFNLISTAIRCVPQGQVCLDLVASREEVKLEVGTVAPNPTPVPSLADQYAETLEMTAQIADLICGTLTVTWRDDPGAPFSACIALPVTEQVTVLIIDDNADVLQLFRRYLADSRYVFIGAQDAQQALELARTIRPRMIVLDVMMPGRDGWTLLGQLREHPQTQDVPVIVCTILAQEELALALGAADFIRKPVKREALLAALEHQWARLRTGSCLET